MLNARILSLSPLANADAGLPSSLLFIPFTCRDYAIFALVLCSIHSFNHHIQHHRYTISSSCPTAGRNSVVLELNKQRVEKRRQSSATGFAQENTKENVTET